MQSKGHHQGQVHCLEDEGQELRDQEHENANELHEVPFGHGEQGVVMLVCKCFWKQRYCPNGQPGVWLTRLVWQQLLHWQI